MATATMPRAGNEIKFEYGVAQKFALKYTTGKNCGEAKFPPFGPRVLFTALDDRRLWLGGEDASDFEHALVDLGIQPADFIRVTKIKHPRGGGHSIRVERADDANDADDAPAWVRDTGSDPDMRHAVRMPPSREVSREEALLEKSVELARERGAAAFHRAPARISPQTPKPAAAHQLMGAFCAAIDACAAAQEYAVRKGLNVAFTSEDVRACAISIYINTERAALAVRY